MHEASLASVVRQNALALLPGAWGAFNYDDLARIRNLSKLPQGAPLVVQEDPNNPTAFVALPGVDGPVDQGLQQ